MIPIVFKNDPIRTNFVLIEKSVRILLKDIYLEHGKIPYALPKRIKNLNDTVGNIRVSLL